MNVNKAKLHLKISDQISTLLTNARIAAMQAHETATHEENKAENKYDTLGLEAAYLAEGQSKRVLELQESLATFNRQKIKEFSDDMEIGLGALVCLKTSLRDTTYFFISPVAGGISIEYEKSSITLLSPQSPLGCRLLSSCVGDEIELNGTSYEVMMVY